MEKKKFTDLFENQRRRYSHRDVHALPHRSVRLDLLRTARHQMIVNLFVRRYTSMENQQSSPFGPTLKNDKSAAQGSPPPLLLAHTHIFTTTLFFFFLFLCAVEGYQRLKTPRVASKRGTRTTERPAMTVQPPTEYDEKLGALGKDGGRGRGGGGGSKRTKRKSKAGFVY